MFVAMNNFKVVSGQEATFEQRWRERTTYLDQVPGFLEFALLRCDTAGEYISHSIWESRAAFEAWTRSEAFSAGHRQGSMQGILAGHPEAKLYESVLVERHGVTA